MVSDARHAAVVAENARLTQQVGELTAQLAAALQRIGALEARITKLEARKTPPPAFVKANAPARPAQVRRPRAAEHNQARRRETPTQIVTHDITHCPACGSGLGGVHVGRRRQVIDLPPPVAVAITEHQVQRGWCSGCARWREAPLDLRAQVLGRGRLGVGIASVVAYLRSVVRLPIRAIQTYLLDLHGLRVSEGEVVGLLHRVAAHGADALAAIRERVRQRRVVHGDETVWREQGQNGYSWLLASPEGERYFEYHHSRAGAVANQLLGEDFAGVLVSDFYAG